MIKTAYRLMLTTALGALVGAPAFGQTAATEVPARTTSSADTQASPKLEAAATRPAQAPQTGAADKDIVVTGSRIVRAGFSAPTPVTVLTTDDLSQKAPSNPPDALNQLPIFQNSISQNTGDSVQSNRVRSGNYLNLRALGPNRLLVLQDGRRVPPTSNNGAVDTNLIPQMLVQRIDVVTGGASAAYGSDAISGVVNFILDKRFSGLKLQVQSGLSKYGDNSSYRAGFAFGHAFLGDRLHVLASAEHYHSDGIPTRTARPDFGDVFDGFGGAGTVANPYRFYHNEHYSTTAFGGLVTSGPLSGRQFVVGGTTVPFNAGTAIGRSGLSTGGEGADYLPAISTLIPTLTTDQFYGRVSYELSDHISFFAEGSYNTATNADQNLVFTRISNMTIFRENAYLAPATLTALGAATSFGLSAIFPGPGTLGSQQHTQSFNGTIGIEGKLGKGWKWDASYIHGDSKFRNDSQDVNLRKFYAALDAVRDPSGAIVCRVTITNPGLLPGCSPFNAFGVGAASQQSIDFIREDTFWATRNKLDSAAANISGDLVDLWAGPLSVAVGGEYRKQSLVQSSNNDPTVPIDLTGIRGFSGTQLFSLLNVGTARGSYSIKEAYLEGSLPLLKDSALGQSANLNAAVRYTDYSTSGTVYTWKIGATYQPIPDVRFRATISRDIRAPSLFELFAGQTINNASVSDPLTGGFGLVPNISGGNPGLKPEIGKTFTGGIVLTPTFVPNLSISVDYYNISITDAISAPFNAAQAIALCFQSGGTNPVCAQVNRPLGQTDTSAANFPTSINITSHNVSLVKMRGIDFEIGYRAPIGSGEIKARALATRLLSSQRQTVAGQPVIETAGTADLPGFNSVVPQPKWRGTFDLSYTAGNFTIGAQERVIGGYDRSHLVTYAENKVPAIAYTDANITFRVPGNNRSLELFATANNLFNKAPIYWPLNGTPGLAIPTVRTTYDIVGLYVTVGGKIRL